MSDNWAADARVGVPMFQMIAKQVSQRKHRPRAIRQIIDEQWLEGCETVGLTSGASVPERLVAQVCAWFRERGAEVREQEPVHEDVRFKLPVELRRAERAAA